MNKIFKSTKSFAIFSLIFAALLGAIMGIWVRIMSTHFDNFQQISARAIIGSLIGFVLYSFNKQVNLSKFNVISKSDIFYILLRTVSLLIGIGLFTFAINNGNFSNINMIYALPTTAILGIFFLKEKLTSTKLFALLLGFFGVILITVKNFSDISMIGAGEIAAVVSTFFYSINYVSRKFMSKTLNNEEIALISSFTMGIFALIVSLMLGNKITNFFILDWKILLVIFMAGLTFILIGVSHNYGFEHIEAIVANNLLILTPFFGLVIGILVYKEVPTLMGLVGGILVIISAVIINYSENKKIEVSKLET